MAKAGSIACEMVTGAAGTWAPRDRLQAFLAEHHAFVWRALRRLGVPDCDVEDASQQVFLVAHRRLAEIVPESERSFLFQTALRVAADWRRARRRRCEKTGTDLADVPDVGADPEELVDQQRRRALLDRVLGAMPLDLRAVFVLFELEEMTMIEIATISDIPPGTVASRLRRARRVFQETVKRLTAGSGARPGGRGEP
jgi:RNA polymerase sigma-70 factor (ECF subfamily)